MVGTIWGKSCFLALRGMDNLDYSKLSFLLHFLLSAVNSHQYKTKANEIERAAS